MAKFKKNQQIALITGVAGLLGSHLSRHLLNNGWRVVGIDNLSGGYKEWLPTDDKSFVFYREDLLNRAKIQRIFRLNRPQVVFHFAAYAAEGLSPFIRGFNYLNNVVASASVINGCIENDSKLIFTSSMAVYGDQQTPFVETLPRKAIDPYGIAKSAVEADIEVAGVQHGLKYSIVRPHNVIGIYQNIWDNYRNVLGIFIRRALNGESLLLFGGGTQLRAFSDVRDYMVPLEQLIDRGDKEIYNLGADRPTTIRELAEIVAEVAEGRGIRVKMEEVEGRHEAFAAFCSHEKAIADLGFQDHTVLKNTVEEMFEWASKEPPRKIKQVEYEIDKGIYKFWRQ
jgi:UDP-glucose 4-epimerase